MCDIGITLQPERRYLDLVAPLAARLADYVEVAPETLWRGDVGHAFEPNGYHREITAFVAATGLGVVGHGVGASLGSADPADTARFARWCEALARDHRTFGFRWYTDHLGATTLAGRNLTLPIALPYVAAAADLVRERLRALQAIVPDVGLENSAHDFVLGDWLDEPAFLGHALDLPRAHLLLDLHNVFTVAGNLGFDPRAWLARVDLTRVVEIHLSGGRPSEPGWLPDGRTRRLDSHDDAVPEPVWELFDAVVDRCPNLRGVTIERMEGTVDVADVAVLERELERARAVVARRPKAAVPPRTAHGPLPTVAPDAVHALQGLLADHLVDGDLAALRARGSILPAPLATAVAGIDADGFRIATLLVAKLRFERLRNGTTRVDPWFAEDPAGFAAAFRRYHRATPPTAHSPHDEAAAFEDWLGRRD